MRKGHIDLYQGHKYINEIKIYHIMDKFIKNNRGLLKNIEDIGEFQQIMLDYFVKLYRLNESNMRLMRNMIWWHSKRVGEHAVTIINHMNSNGYNITDNDEYKIFTAILLHDIGKFITVNDKSYDNDDHAIVSYIMAKYLLDKDQYLSKQDRNDILEMILMHSNKTEHRQQISLLSKIIRDADLFDERCGDSLETLLMLKINCPGKSLNTLEYDESDKIVKKVTRKKYYKKIHEKINIEINESLFKSEQQRAIDKYYDYKWGRNFKTELEDLLKMNIDL